MLQLSAKTLAQHLDPTALIEALREAFRGAPPTMPPRAHHLLDDEGRMLLMMPAWHAGRSLGIKLVTVVPRNSVRNLPGVHASYVLFDADTGAPRATLDGTELTRRRTAAASALAASYLALPSASRLLMVGTGALVPHFIESHALVRPIRSVRIWGRRASRARDVAAALAGRPFAVEASEDLEASVSWADVICCATAATEPLVLGRWLRAGQHLDLVGSFTAAMREADDEALSRAEIYVDTRDGALSESGELLHALASGAIAPDAVLGELSDLVRGTCRGRRSATSITLFKSVGTALEDLAAAELAVRATTQVSPGR